MTAVEEDGRWYALVLLHDRRGRPSRGGPTSPETGIEPKGGESPEGAVDVLLDGVEQLDLTAIIAGLNPNEAQALQRYAPLFIGDAQAALDELPLDLEVTDIEYDVEGRRQHPLGDDRTDSSAQGTVRGAG